MTGETRHQLRSLIDQARRQRVAREDVRENIKRCCGCGAEYDCCTIGCDACNGRRARRLRR